MQTNLLEYLENTVREVPDKLAFSNGERGVTFDEVYRFSRAIGTFLNGRGLKNEPVIVFMEKSPEAVVSFFGTVYAGCYYVPLDSEMPVHRIEIIVKTLKTRAAICDEATASILKELSFGGDILLYSDIISGEENTQALEQIRSEAIDTDPVYIVFTSGSTGIPKGVVACHRSVIDYIENLSAVLKVDRDTVFGNQAPLYFDACLKELYPTLKFGATTYLIPRKLFMMPLQLIDFLNEHKINTVCWVVSALTVISGLGALSEKVPKYLRTIAFGSEVFPIKQFQLWRQTLPATRFINLYGPTEATGMSCYYEVDREFDLCDVIPIGRPFKNTRVLLINDDGKPAADGEPGEIYICGTPVTLGYFNDRERTAEVFVQNPLNTAYPETVYRTGDIARRNDRGELEFISRKDYQIKHMGHRIELGEIELIASAMDGVAVSCCIFDDIRKKIVLYFTGEASPATVTAEIRKKLPRYMMPNTVFKLDVLPQTPNGKINRRLLKEQYMNNKQ